MSESRAPEHEALAIDKNDGASPECDWVSARWRRSVGKRYVCCMPHSSASPVPLSLIYASSCFIWLPLSLCFFPPLVFLYHHVMWSFSVCPLQPCFIGRVVQVSGDVEVPFTDFEEVDYW